MTPVDSRSLRSDGDLDISRFADAGFYAAVFLTLEYSFVFGVWNPSLPIRFPVIFCGGVSRLL